MPSTGKAAMKWLRRYLDDKEPLTLGATGAEEGEGRERLAGSVAVAAARVSVTCPECGGRREVASRSAARISAGEASGRCQHCRSRLRVVR